MLRVKYNNSTVSLKKIFIIMFINNVEMRQLFLRLAYNCLYIAQNKTGW